MKPPPMPITNQPLSLFAFPSTRRRVDFVLRPGVVVVVHQQKEGSKQRQTSQGEGDGGSEWQGTRTMCLFAYISQAMQHETILI